MAKRKNRNKEEWKALIEAQLESGLSAAGFCRQHQINPKYFSKRKTELMRLAHKPEPASAFVKIQPFAQATQSASIHLQYKNARLQLPPGVGCAWVAGLLELLP
jgi:hypothetical protein